MRMYSRCTLCLSSDMSSTDKYKCIVIWFINVCLALNVSKNQKSYSSFNRVIDSDVTAFASNFKLCPTDLIFGYFAVCAFYRSDSRFYASIGKYVLQKLLLYTHVGVCAPPCL